MIELAKVSPSMLAALFEQEQAKEAAFEAILAKEGKNAKWPEDWAAMRDLLTSCLDTENTVFETLHNAVHNIQNRKCSEAIPLLAKVLLTGFNLAKMLSECSELDKAFSQMSYLGDTKQTN